ncbi:MAG: UDP-4-amino-4,6-dideoxy-N-acetyl-beta-L-altrosamine transaminase [Turneriella sp.]
MIPYGRQNINDQDIEGVVSVLQSDWLTQGPLVPRFENLTAEYCSARYAIAVCNATAALHIACLALQLGPGDSMWTSPNTFVASANCALYCGAKVDFVDIDPKTYNMSVSALEAKLIRAEKEGGLPKVVIPVHFAGQSCDMLPIRNLADRFGFRIIEDASHAIGGKYRNEPIGKCSYSDITVFSFHPVKIITTGEGGMALTNDPELADRMQLFRSHGITRDSEKMHSASHGDWYYQQIELGYNFRMTDMQAALGVSQLQRLDGFVERRHILAGEYETALSKFDVITPWQDPLTYSAFHLYPVQFVMKGADRRKIFDLLRKAGVGVNVHYIPVHTQPYYAKMGFHPEDFPETMKYYSRTVTLPLYPGLKKSEQEKIIAEVKNQHYKGEL